MLPRPGHFESGQRSLHILLTHVRRHRGKRHVIATGRCSARRWGGDESGEEWAERRATDDGRRSSTGYMLYVDGDGGGGASAKVGQVGESAQVRACVRALRGERREKGTGWKRRMDVEVEVEVEVTAGPQQAVPRCRKGSQPLAA
ncbi:hypothetical protein PCL_09717 [Purpureocillium lilacinum]|uniref:Uncharacterized protein n=1 Tax=Purpureocillium lilacinum TaxID=33203 RepID=A0A2U3EDZ8_PURLI|nr:hypothetical protein PCL_09717 [Purpureocillium lilacinum]